MMELLPFVHGLGLIEVAFAQLGALITSLAALGALALLNRAKRVNAALSNATVIETLPARTMTS